MTTIVTIGFTGMLTLFWPIFVWFEFRFTLVDTHYWTLRYLIYLFYIALSNLRWPAIDFVQFMMCDGLLLSQICCMLIYNELSIGCLIFCLTPFFMAWNFKFAIDLILYKKEPEQKTTFVRLMGVPKTLTLFLSHTFFIMFCSAIDSITNETWNFLILTWLYVPWTFFVVNRLMDGKNTDLKRSWLPFIVGFGTFAAIIAYLFI